MTNPIYAALSRQTALERELATLANNIANASTIGFRADSQIFSEYVNAIRGEPSLSQTRLGGRAFKFEQGDLIATGGRLDLAIEGEGFFVVETPQGERLTRAGAFLRNEAGVLVTPEGYAVQSEGGGAIAIADDAASVVIAQDGVISANGAAIARIRVVRVDPTTLAREGSSLFLTTGDIAEIAPQVRQGFLEASNVQPVLALSRLIEVQRAFELGQQLIASENDRIGRAVDLLGGAR